MIPDCVLHFLIGDVVLVGNSEEFTYTSHLCGPTFLLYILCEGSPLTRVQEYWDDEASASVLSFTRVRRFCLSKWSSVWKELLLSVLSWKILQALNLRSELLYPGTRICVLASCKSQCRCHLYMLLVITMNSSALISMPPAVDVQSRASISSRKYKLVIVLPVMLIVTYWSSNASTIVFLNKMLRKVAPPLKVYMIVLLLMGEKITLFLSFLNIMLNWFYFRKNMFMGPHTFCKNKIVLRTNLSQLYEF